MTEGRRKREGEYVWTALALGVAEALGTGLLVFLGCMGGVPGLTEAVPPHMQASFAFGLTVFLAVQIFGHISGAHVNPAVTIAAWIWGAISLPTFGLYIIAQFLGALLGYGALMTLAPLEAFYPRGDFNLNNTHGLCTTVPNPLISSFQAVLAEFFATTVLILLCCAVWDKRNSIKQDSVPLKFGFAITCIALAEGPLTGASMNPARSFAPAVYTGVWERHWVYWLAPCAAAVITTYLYKFIFDRTIPDEFDQSDVPLNEIKQIKVQNTEKTASVEALPNV